MKPKFSLGQLVKTEFVHYSPHRQVFGSVCGIKMTTNTKNELLFYYLLSGVSSSETWYCESQLELV